MTQGGALAPGVPHHPAVIEPTAGPTDCMRCGLCLPHCPTFALNGLEKESPRGRLALMRAFEEGRLDITRNFQDAIRLCLGCRACESACPAGVPYSRLLENVHARIEAEQARRRSPLINGLLNALVGGLLYGPHGLEPIVPWIRIYQKIGLHRLHLGRFLPGPVRFWELLLPPIPPRSAHAALGEFVPARPPIRGRVGLLTGCLENTLLSNVPLATARVLAREGFEVVIPRRQVCCGALPHHLGRTEQARRQARENIAAFEAAGVETVISDAAGCSTQLREYGRLLADDPEFARRAARFAAGARDITTFLASILPFRNRLNPQVRRVTYDDPCQLVHGQGSRDDPRRLIRAIPGLEFLELPEADWCCGSAGTYNLTHPDLALKLLERKMTHVRSVAPHLLLTANTGCALQLTAGVALAGLEIEVLHIVELIDRAMKG